MIKTKINKKLVEKMGEELVESLKKLERFENHPVLKEIIKDAYGGVIYDVDNRNKYDTKELLELHDSLSPVEKESLNRIITGAINFIKGN